jgi:hypothetical protein
VKIKIKITGVGAELVMGNYLTYDTLIFTNWEEFYHYNDVLHQAQLLIEHITEIEITNDGVSLYKGLIPKNAIFPQKSYSPLFEQGAFYLRTECVEQCVYTCNFETEDLDLSNFRFESQDYNMLFKVGKSFLVELSYANQPLTLEWHSGKPIGNICLLCKYDSGYLVPVYDAVNKISSK